ncbi:hypothetical protein M514_25721 [Trichuris suis]|uniref:Uncharacterized protein n=1 Tax=Trichuris suis TaxID=68888 RepID=A0A085MY23_9BILA|nr:hypothetical protein M514_25721 [Trichuris suis]
MKAGNTKRTKVDQKTGSSSFSCRVGAIISFRGVRQRPVRLSVISRSDWLEILNLEFPNVITFTIEKEVEGKIPFLDTLIIRTQEGKKTKVYRIPTHSDKYVEFTSHHPHVMMGTLHGMVDRG